MAEVFSPISGNVWKIQKAVGDSVEMDDEIFILEALKMETPVYCDEDGTVAEIRVKEGDAVNEGDVLMVLK